MKAKKKNFLTKKFLVKIKIMFGPKTIFEVFLVPNKKKIIFFEKKLILKIGLTKFFFLIQLFDHTECKHISFMCMCACIHDESYEIGSVISSLTITYLFSC